MTVQFDPESRNVKNKVRKLYLSTSSIHQHNRLNKFIHTIV